jgi:hypothetical protein
MAGPDDIRTGSEWSATFEGFWAEVQYCNEDGAVQLVEYDKENDDPLPTNMVTTSQHYGFYSRLPEGTEVLTWDLVNGEVVHHGDNHDRPNLANKGQVRMADISGNYMDLLAGGGGILVHAKGSAPITLQTDAAQFINLLGQVYCGSMLASEAMVKGTTLHTAWTTYLAAYQTFVTAWVNATAKIKTDIDSGDSAEQALTVPSAGVGYCPAMDTAFSNFTPALTALITSLANWLSTKHKLDA